MNSLRTPGPAECDIAARPKMTTAREAGRGQSGVRFPRLASLAVAQVAQAQQADPKAYEADPGQAAT